MFRILIIIILLFCVFSFKKDQALTLFTDNRDGNQYRIVLINNLYWFQDELKFLPAQKKDSFLFVQHDNEVYYSIFTKDNVCPIGWRLPSIIDWKNYIIPIIFSI